MDFCMSCLLFRVDDHLFSDTVATVSTYSIPFKIHLSLSIFVCTLTFFIWRWTSTNLLTTVNWWWMYPLFGFGVSLSVHRYIFETKEYVKGVTYILALINIMLFFTNYIIQQDATFPWFIYPMFASLMAVVALKNRANPEKYDLVQLCFLEYSLLNTMLFITWVLVKGFPWFFFPLIGLAVPLVIFYVRETYKESRPWFYVTIINVGIGLIVFIIWVFTDILFPWFLMVWVGLAAICGAVWYIRAEEYINCIRKRIFPDAEMEPVGFV
eukprot:TRINITY_DN1531_c0_g1_i1.p1 TRINITY_DN1531_c0_g1~~TRINITY_DN1531_c0_g1_i1.p1  ORF type:complete len:268 (-),score=15.43 TRINITY_DN1531_c0_g1_i1:64-867(-)